MRRPAALLALLVVLAPLTGGCGHDDARRRADWARAERPLVVHGPVWAQAGVVHLGDAGTIRTSPRMDDYVVAGDGIYFRERRRADGSAVGHLLHAGATGVADTGVAISGWDELRASPGGRYLAYIDRTTGPTDEFGTHLAAGVVVDTTTGREVVHTFAAMGDTATDDLADLYEDATPPQIVGLTDSEAWVAGPDGLRTYALPGGEQTHAYDGVDLWSKRRPWVFRYGLALRSTWNLARTWAIDADARPHPRLHGADGTEVTPMIDAPRWVLVRWIDADTVLGYAYDDASNDPASVHPITCAVPTGACRRIPGVDGKVRLPRPSVG